MVPIFIFYLSLIIPTVSFQFRTNNKYIGNGLFLTIASYISLIFLSGILLGRLDIGFYLIIAINIFLVFYILKKCIFNRQIITLSLDYFIFTCFFIFTIFINRNRNVIVIDEFNHWADIVKIMCQFNDFGTHPGTDSWYASYPPGMALFQYFFQKIKISFGSGYSDWALYTSYQLCAISPFFILFRHIKNNYQKVLFFILSAVAITALDNSIQLGINNYLTYNPYISTYIDPMLSILAAIATIEILISSHEKNYISLISICACCVLLILMKDAGLLLAIFIVLIYLSNSKDIRNSLIVASSILIPKLLWIFEIKNSNIEKAFSNKVDIVEYIFLLFGKGDSQKLLILNLFKNQFLIKDRLFNFFNINYLTVGIIIFSTLCIALIKKRKTFILLLTEMFIYLVGLSITYIYKFTIGEALRVVGFTRYIKIMYLYLLLVAIIILIFHLFSSSNNASLKSTIFVSITLILFISPYDIKNFINGGKDDYSNHLKEQTDYISNIAYSGQKVLVINEGYSVYDFRFFRYNLRPIICENGSFSTEFINDYTSVMSNAELKQYIFENFDYVYVLHAYDEEWHEEKYEFVKNYSSLFENGQCYDGWLYKVDSNNNVLIHVE